MYAVDEVFFTDELAEKLKGLAATPRLLLIHGINSDSKNPSPVVAFDGLADFLVDKVLFLSSFTYFSLDRLPHSPPVNPVS